MPWNAGVADRSLTPTMTEFRGFFRNCKNMMDEAGDNRNTLLIRLCKVGGGGDIASVDRYHLLFGVYRLGLIQASSGLCECCLPYRR